MIATAQLEKNNPAAVKAGIPGLISLFIFKFQEISGIRMRIKKSWARVLHHSPNFLFEFCVQLDGAGSGVCVGAFSISLTA